MPDSIKTETRTSAERRVITVRVRKKRKTTQQGNSFAMLIRGSADKKEDAAVQRRKSTIIRSNLERRKPVAPVARVRRIQPAAAIATAISAPAIECGAKRT
jgi:hypothetical protein